MLALYSTLYLRWDPAKSIFSPCGLRLDGDPKTHCRLVVVLQGHGNHVEADDEGDEDVQVVASAHGVDEQPCGTVGGIVGQPLSLCREHGRVAQTIQDWTKHKGERGHG